MTNATTPDRIQRLREDAQRLHKAIQGNVHSDEATVKAGLEKAIAAAHQIQIKAKEAADMQKTEGSEKLQEASAKFAEAAAKGKAALKASGAALQIKVREMAEDARDALNRVTDVVAERRSGSKGSK